MKRKKCAFEMRQCVERKEGERERERERAHLVGVGDSPTADCPSRGLYHRGTGGGIRTDVVTEEEEEEEGDNGSLKT